MLLILGIESCKKDPDLTQSPNAIRFTVPDGWPAPFYNFANNTVSKDGFELGRRIFYDTRLSRDNSISCGSCHQSFTAFAHADHIVSHGIDGLLGTRNSPSLFNLAWNKSFFWDGGVNHIESQPPAPISNPVEMDEDLTEVVTRLSADADYRDRFEKVFGTSEVNTQRIMRALAQFMGAMVSANSKFDQSLRGEAVLSPQEQSGLIVFQSNCATCHPAPLFTDEELHNNGLPVTAVNDSGRARITHLAEDLQKFKVPSLRNLGFTPPYMHDGRFRTLDEVLDHYGSGIVITPSLDPRLSSGITLTVQQREDLKSFLVTLNDSSFVSDARFTEVH